MTSDKTMVEEMARAIFEAMDITDGLTPDSAERYAQAAATIAQRRVEELRDALSEMLAYSNARTNPAHAQAIAALNASPSRHP